MSAVEHSVAGTCGGLAAALLLYPLDTIRTRLQAGRDRGGDNSLMELLRGDDALALLYRGLGPSLTTVGVSQGAGWGPQHHGPHTAPAMASCLSAPRSRSLCVFVWATAHP